MSTLDSGDNTTTKEGRIGFIDHLVQFQGNINMLQRDKREHLEFLDTECQDCECITLDISQAIPCDCTIFYLIAIYIEFAREKGKHVKIIDKPHSVVHRYLDSAMGTDGYEFVLI